MSEVVRERSGKTHDAPSYNLDIPLPSTSASTLSRALSPETGSAYLIYASDNNQNFKISRLDANYYNVVTQVSVISSKHVLHVPSRGSNLTLSRVNVRVSWNHQTKRSMFSYLCTSFVINENSQVYHLFASKTTGWDPNANKVVTASVSRNSNLKPLLN